MGDPINFRRIRSSLFLVEQEPLRFWSRSVFPAIAEQHAVNDGTVRFFDRLDVVVFPDGIFGTVRDQVSFLFPGVSLVGGGPFFIAALRLFPGVLCPVLRVMLQPTVPSCV